jgi:hypothetical protein
LRVKAASSAPVSQSAGGRYGGKTEDVVKAWRWQGIPDFIRLKTSTLSAAEAGGLLGWPQRGTETSRFCDFNLRV